MTVDKLIKQYQEKIQVKDAAIAKIRQMIRDARNGETQSDIEDLTEEKNNAQRDRQLYFQFVKDLEDLIED